MAHSRPALDAGSPSTRETQDDSLESWFAAATRSLVASAPAVEIGTMLHAQGLKVDGRFFAFVRDGALVVKLPKHRVSDLTAAGGGQPFRSGRRTMSEWIAVRPITTREMVDYLIEARTHTATPERKP